MSYNSRQKVLRGDLREGREKSRYLEEAEKGSGGGAQVGKLREDLMEQVH